MTKAPFLGFLLIALSFLSCEKGFEGGQVVTSMAVSKLTAKAVSYQVQDQYWIFSDSINTTKPVKATKLGLLVSSELNQIAMERHHSSPTGSFFSPAYAVNLVLDFKSTITDLKIYSRQAFEGFEPGEPLNGLFYVSWHSPNVKDDYYLGLQYTLDEFLNTKPKPKQQLLFSLKEPLSQRSEQEFYVVYQDSSHPEPLHANFPALEIYP